MKRCVTRCRLCVINEDIVMKDAFHVEKPQSSYQWCVYRHSEPLRRGEYEVMVKDDGAITGTICYRTNIVPKTKYGRGKSKSGGVL